MPPLILVRPLAFFDLETTGIDPRQDKIVEIAIVRREPDGTRHGRVWRVDPERPIPKEATAVHGIRDEDVRGLPPFRAVAPEIVAHLADADLAGYNVRKFDVPLLERELKESGVDLALAGRRVIDAMTIFHRKEPRDLSAAVKFFLGRMHDGAHGAEADVLASLDVLEAQLARYDDLPATVEELERWLYPRVEGAVDREGKFIVREGEIVFAFGRQKGKPLREVARVQRDYLEWILRSDFPDDARRLVEAALRGE